MVNSLYLKIKCFSIKNTSIFLYIKKIKLKSIINYIKLVNIIFYYYNTRLLTTLSIALKKKIW